MGKLRISDFLIQTIALETLERLLLRILLSILRNTQLHMSAPLGTEAGQKSLPPSKCTVRTLSKQKFSHRFRNRGGCPAFPCGSLARAPLKDEVPLRDFNLPLKPRCQLGRRLKITANPRLQSR
ncbi:hypothetical protein TNCV_3831451 [Trichonephila clavipes]|nr:hypothetical protein TNCV_3831451 [Trichonephila clavipes]